MGKAGALKTLTMAGSNPPTRTKYRKRRTSGLSAKQVNRVKVPDGAPSLADVSQPWQRRYTETVLTCGFESHRRHHAAVVKLVKALPSDGRDFVGSSPTSRTIVLPL